MPSAVSLDHAWIERHIPHQGRMCLLDHVDAWDQERIRCHASSHRSMDNPLRAHGRLGAVCGIEYAAQAMAVHGALLAPDGSASQCVGYLVSVREAKLWVKRLDDISEDLQIEALCMTRGDNNILYRFTIDAGARRVLEGRAAVVLDAQGLAGGMP